MMKLPVSVIIVTYNEEANIEDCLKSVSGWVEDIFIVDSFSADKTCEIAKSFGVKVYQNRWVNYAAQFNWALENLPIKSEWIMRLDADERVTLRLKDELLERFSYLDKDVSGLYLKRKVYFMGKWIKHGGYYPIWLLRIWRRAKGYCEPRWMDEHIEITEGRVLFLGNDIVEENKKNLHWWIEKHNSYATREAIDMLNLKYKFFTNDMIPSRISGTQEEKKRWLKENVYAKLPLFIRPFLYFFYRYFLKLGILDGKEGLIWHFLQCFWYRFLVDAKIYEIYIKAGKDKESIKKFIQENYRIVL
jgi:glycosyltransferase involved in cell wall biosynthesis